MLYEVATSSAPRTRIAEEFSHDIQLMVTGEDLLQLLAPGPLILYLDDLGVVFNDVRKPRPCEDVPPEIVGLDAIRIHGITGPVVITFIERKEPGIFPAQLRTETYLLIVHREVRHTAPELEEKLARIAILLVLLHSIFDRLLRQWILQLEGGDGQAVDKDAEIECKFCLVFAISELAGDAEDIRGELLNGLSVSGGGRAVE